jgi:fatty-acyl-CoA synthase
MTNVIDATTTLARRARPPRRSMGGEEIMTVYVERLLDSLTHAPRRVVMHWRGKSLSAGELADAVRGAATVLSADGVAPGTTVAILTEPNSPPILTARFAAHLLGAAVTHVRSMNARTDAGQLPPEEQARVLREAGAAVLVVDELNAERGHELARRVPGLLVRHVDEMPAAGAGPAAAPYRPAATAVIDLTSGTTNAPKLVVQSYASREARIRVAAGETEPDRPVVLLCVTPVSHATATMVDAALLGGGAVVLHEEFDVPAVLRAIAELRVTDVYLAVPHLYRLIDHPGLAGADLSSLRMVLYSGTVPGPARLAQAYAIFGDRLCQLYGSTEAGGMCALNPIDHAEPELLATVGRPFSWMELEVRDPDTGAPAPRGDVGEVWVRSDTLMSGYLGDPGPDAPTLRDGWLGTGDLARWDVYGYLHLVGRHGNIIKTNGLKIYPATVERVLLAHPAIADVAVFQECDPERGELSHAAVQWRPGSSATVDDLVGHVTAALSPEYVPDLFTFCRQIPLGPTGKPDLASLRASYEKRETSAVRS